MKSELPVTGSARATDKTKLTLLRHMGARSKSENLPTAFHMERAEEMQEVEDEGKFSDLQSAPVAGTESTWQEVKCSFKKVAMDRMDRKVKIQKEKNHRAFIILIIRTGSA